MGTLLDVRDLQVRFRRPEGIVHAVNGVSFQVKEGEWLGVLGESGSGKSVSLMSLLRLLGDNGYVEQGEAYYGNRDLLKLSERQLQTIRGKSVGVLFQNLMFGLNPWIPIGHQIVEPMVQHAVCNKPEAKRRAIQLLSEMGIPDPESQFSGYSFELSGGMRQRVMLAVALACEPQLLIADEPTTALDATVQTQVLSLLRQACERRQMTTVMITHDLGVAANVCDRVMVMYGGMIMEVAEVDDFIQRPAHPYTLGLKGSMIDLRHRGKALQSIPGVARTLWHPPKGCPFVDRCAFAVDLCKQKRPVLRTLSDGHEVACHRAEEVVANAG